MLNDINTNITLTDLKTIEDRVNSKKETIEDYQTIDLCLTKFGLPKDYMQSTLSTFGIFSLEQLKEFRTNPPSPRDPIREGKINGTLSGLIIYLKNQF